MAVGCVALPPSPAGPGAAPGAPARLDFPGLDPGAKRLAGLRFEVHAYSSDRASAVSELAERLYERIMTDTGLYSFLPGRQYPLVVYGTREEYLAKTGLPPWSGGAAVGGAIYAYDGPHLPGVLAHEMTHLVFHEYMGRSRRDLLWLNEGLAVYEEQEAAPGEAPPRFSGVPIPFQEMVRIQPLSEQERSVSVWYQQAAAVVRYLIERGGHIGFSQLLRELRDGRSLDDALRTGFPGRFKGFADLEETWRMRP